MCDRFPRKFDVQTSYKPSNYVLGLIFVVNIKFPRGTYHTIVPSTEELYCLNTDNVKIALSWTLEGIRKNDKGETEDNLDKNSRDGTRKGKLVLDRGAKDGKG